MLCPQAVRTAMTQGLERDISSVDGMIEPEALADCVIDGLADERFLILPHPTALYERCGEHRLCSPNDLVFDKSGGFWFTDLSRPPYDSVRRPASTLRNGRPFFNR